jgi:Kdo2-lipid IVA lauroyltransferase/acyltransferase
VSRFAKRLKNNSIFAAIRILVFLHGLLPRRVGHMLFSFMGALIFCFPHREKRRTIEHLTVVFGDSWTHKKIRSTARRVYSDLGINFFDALYFARNWEQRLPQYVRCDDLSAFKEAYDRGKGIMAITAHCGCFEMLLHYFALQGFNCFAIGSRLYDKRLDALVGRLRSGRNIQYVHRSGNLRALLKLIRQGMVMGALIDQDTHVDGVFAHFMGKLAYTPSSAVKMAMRYDIPLFVVTTARCADGTHGIFVNKELQLHVTGNEEEDLVRALETINSEISATITQYPSQWVWMHRRWRRKIIDPAYSDCPSIERYES